MALIEFTEKGFYCREADVFIDPSRPVKKALITHGHSDHARTGHGQYLCAEASVGIIRQRLGKNIAITGQTWGEPLTINGVRFSFHPAGHIAGSAQIRVEYRGEIWVVTGDYKTQTDPVSEPFEPVRCHSIITESTFALPVYQWQPGEVIAAEINQWWQETRDSGELAILAGYSLGKAQHLLALLDPSIGPIIVHPVIHDMNQVIAGKERLFPEYRVLEPEMDHKATRGALLLAPPGSVGNEQLDRFRPFRTAMASGWMAVRRSSNRVTMDRGFVLSDHADWAGLNLAIRESGAHQVLVTHGYTEIFSRWLREQGYDARAIGHKVRSEETPDDGTQNPGL